MLNALRFPSRLPLFAIALIVMAATSLEMQALSPVFNPDSMLYFHAADLFAAGRWTEGFEIFHWPFYSLAIAAVMKITGLGVEPVTILLDLLLDGVLVLAFVGLIGRLAPDRPWLLVAAALVIVLHPRLIQFRPTVIRDHGFLAFFFLALYCVQRDRVTPRAVFKAAAALAVIAAAAFRPEALVLALVIPGFFVYERCTTRLGRAGVIAALLALMALAVPAYVVRGGDFSAAAFAGTFSRVTTAIGALAAQLPEGRNVGLLAYGGYVTFTLVDGVLRAITIPIAILSLLAFVPRRWMSAEAARFVGWFAGWQIPVLLIFTGLSLYFDWRYATAFALLASIPAVFFIAAVFEALAARERFALTGLVAILVVLIVPWFLAVPRQADLTYLQEAGKWVGRTLPPDARYVTNDGRLAYYAGFSYRQFIFDQDLQRIAKDYPEADYALVDVIRDDAPVLIAAQPHAALVMTFPGRDGRRVAIYKLR